MGFDMDKLSGDKKNKRNKKEVSKMIQEKSLENRVLITGFRSDIDEILSALDIFVLPSKYEGLPISRHRRMGLRALCQKMFQTLLTLREMWSFCR